MLNVTGLMTIAYGYDMGNMAFLGCMAAFFVVLVVDGIRIALRNRGHLFKTLLSHPDTPTSTAVFILWLVFLIFRPLIPIAAYPAIAWTAFTLALVLITIRLIRD